MGQLLRSTIDGTGADASECWEKNSTRLRLAPCKVLASTHLFRCRRGRVRLFKEWLAGATISDDTIQMDIISAFTIDRFGAEVWRTGLAPDRWFIK